MNLLKKLGRVFFILTEEEHFIKNEDIKAVLIINSGETHFEEALDVIKRRFSLADIKMISGSKIKGVISRLHELREEQFSAVIILSLNPFVIFFVSLFFHCYFFIYNRFGQWFSIRRKTLYEFLIGRRGADKEKEDWNILPIRISFARSAMPVIFLPYILIRKIYQAIKLFFYLAFNLSYLFLRRLIYIFIK
jgi:hypothetical protein